MKSVTHECCEDARALLRGYPHRTQPPHYRWHLLGVWHPARNPHVGLPVSQTIPEPVYVTHCAWCGAHLEQLRLNLPKKES